jgi:hypothetical protein
MVLQRTIENLRDRPRHEREAVAFWIAVAIVIVLTLAWGVYFFRNTSAPDFSPVNNAYTEAVNQFNEVGQQIPKAGNTGWVSSGSQSASVEATSDDLQIIQTNDPQW